MSKAKTLFWIGIWVAILPYMGFPFFIKNVIFSLTGLVLVYIAWINYVNLLRSNTKDKNFDNFSENVFTESNG